MKAVRWRTKICLQLKRSIRVILCENEVCYYNAKTFSYAFRHQNYTQTKATVRVVRLSFRTKTPPCTKRSVLEKVENFGVARQSVGVKTPPCSQYSALENVGKLGAARKYSPSRSTRRIARQLAISHRYVLWILCSDLRLFPYQIAELPKIAESDKEQSLHFATWATRTVVNSTALGYPKKLVFVVMNSSLSKRLHSMLRKIHFRFNRETIKL